tara:strand:+ start:621 stop:785 length:165 start_codon:yes stop_codon:yes gene_type:complete
MSNTILKNSQMNNKVNVYELKSKIRIKEKKEKFQNKIIYLSLLTSIGVLGYFLS